MVQMDKKAAPVQQPILPAGLNDGETSEDGFTLLEVVCVIAMLALLAAVVMPILPHGTSRARLESYAIATAALLKADHEAALRRQTQVATDVNAMSRLIRSGATGRIVRVPDDVAFDALLPARCGQYRAGFTVHFFSSGMSCGGVITLSRLGSGYEVRVNWLTGGVEIVPINPT
jgi:general secretion pathway protein H